MTQRGPSALDALGAGLMPRLWDYGRALWGPRIFFGIICIQLLVLADSASITQQSRVHGQMAAAQRSMRASLERCPPGYHVSEAGNCTLCLHGVEYTSHWNYLSSCLPCTVCKPDEEEISPCIQTGDAECRCKPGTFRGEDILEFCQKCKTGCPDGMVEASPCTPWRDLQCVHQGSGTRATGKATVSGEPVIGGLGSPASPSPPSGDQTIVIVIVMVIVVVCVAGMVVAYVLCSLRKRRTCQGYGEDTKCLVRVLLKSSCFPRGREAQDNANNQILSAGDSQSTLDPAREDQGPEQVELLEAAAQAPVEEEPLLDQVKVQGSQGPPRRKMVLVIANGADPSETLRSFFSYFSRVVPFDSWTPVMRLVGLTDNEIQMAKADAGYRQEELYEMLSKWLRTKGRDASVNTLLGALETLGERDAMEKIQDHLVSSGKYIYQECRADSLCCMPGDENTASGNESFAG